MPPTLEQMIATVLTLEQAGFRSYPWCPVCQENLIDGDHDPECGIALAQAWVHDEDERRSETRSPAPSGGAGGSPPAAGSNLRITCDEDGELDDLFARGVTSAHLERMNEGHWWLGLEVGDQVVHVHLSAARPDTTRVSPTHYVEPVEPPETPKP